MSPLTTTFGGLAGFAYIDRVIADHSPIAVWPQADLSGSQCTEVVNGWHGTYTGVTLNDAQGPDGQPVPRYDGVNDFTQLFSAALAAAMNQAEMTLLVWAKISTWGNDDHWFRLVWDSGDISYCYLTSSTKNRYGADWNGYANSLEKGDFNHGNWQLWGYRWKFVVAGDVIRLYVDGVKESNLYMGSKLPQGTLSSFLIGAKTDVPANVFDGWLGPVFLFDSGLEDADILDIATV